MEKKECMDQLGVYENNDGAFIAYTRIHFDTVTINADIIGMTVIECSCGLSVGPVYNVWDAVERYNNRAGEEKYKYEMYMMEERLQDMYDEYRRLLSKWEKEEVLPDDII